MQSPSAIFDWLPSADLLCLCTWESLGNCSRADWTANWRTLVRIMAWRQLAQEAFVCRILFISTSQPNYWLADAMNWLIVRRCGMQGVEAAIQHICIHCLKCSLSSDLILGFVGVEVYSLAQTCLSWQVQLCCCHRTYVNAVSVFSVNCSGLHAWLHVQGIYGSSTCRYVNVHCLTCQDIDGRTDYMLNAPPLQGWNRHSNLH